jgi:putative DNA methylase
MTHPVKSPKKLIEVALPLDAINVASAKEKSIRHGHPSTLHLWWARRPLAAARAVIFSQLVNDPSWKWELESPGQIPPNHLKASWAASRKRLFKIIEDLVLWENTTNETVLEAAREEIRKSWREVCELNQEHPQAAELFNPDKLPALHDPFAGGGSIPLEAQRLGLEAYASDLNPVAVLINKAMIEIPPKFAGRPPVHPSLQMEAKTKSWKGAQGLAADVRAYGAWMREEAHKRIGHLYPPVEITKEMAEEREDLKTLVGQKLTVIAWLWARTVKSPNPAFSHVEVPLASTFILGSKDGKEAYVQPVVEGDKYRFTVKVGKPPANAENGTKLGRGANFSCVLSGTPIEPKYIYAEATAKRMGARLLAVVAEGARGRFYLAPNDEIETITYKAEPAWQPDLLMPENPRWFSPPLYGLKTYGDLFTPRQLVALTTFGDIVSEAREFIRRDAILAGMVDNSIGVDAGGIGATAYAEAVTTYLAFAVSKATDRNSSLCFWESAMTRLRGTFGRQALPMVWDFAETNPFAGAGGDIYGTAHSLCEVLDNFFSSLPGLVKQLDAQSQDICLMKVVSTDPPYYDNIGYADLSDFFYVWLRRTLRSVFPALFATLAVPKGEELVATPYRHGGKEKAEEFFMTGMMRAMERIASQAHPAFPTTIYYAFKQSETGKEGTASTGWETFLDAVIRSGFSIDGTWPMRTELTVALKKNISALASSIVLVCRKRPPSAATVSRREFLRELNAVLPEALDEMTKGSGGDHSPVAPVDLSQAIIGPGMAIFSKYAAVLEADGKSMSVKTALQLINRFLAEDDFDGDTQFCLRWFEQYGWKEGAFGQADVLARSKATSVDGLSHAGVLQSDSGKVQLLKWSEYPTDWDPATDTRLPVWEVLHHFIRVLKKDGESGAGKLLALVTGKAEAARQLAYRLYTLCERQGWAEDARAYNELITSWSGIESAAAQVPVEPKQGTLL